MSNRTMFILASFLAVGFLACGEKSEATTADEIPTTEEIEQTIAQAVEEQTGAKPSTDTTPCEVLDERVIRASFDIGSDVQLTRKPSKYSPHPLCTVSWPKPNAAELEKNQASAISDYMQRKMKGEDVKMPSFRTSNEVSLTLYEPQFDSPQEAVASFDLAMKRLSEGMTASHQDIEMTFQADVTPVEGVGSKAMWAPKLRQLSVVDRNRIFHVGVNTGAELNEELEKAKAIARDIAQAL